MHDINDSVLLENILDLFPAGIFWKDKERRFMGANQMFLDYYGLDSVDQIIGKNDEDMGWHIDPEPYRRVELQVINSGESIRDVPGECIVKGKLRKISASKCPIYSEGEVVGLIGYFMDVTDEMEELDRLSFLSQIDDLTGVLNRRAYNDIVLEYEEQYRQNKTDFVLYLVDMDQYKTVNDRYGHEYGDLFLTSVAQSLSAVAAENSVLCRYDGDEFAIIHQFTSESDIAIMKRRIMRAVEGPRNLDGVKLSVKASIGQAIYSETESVLTMEELADKRLYEMKKNKY
ncbi:MAG: GGDEF domain-containing protein [Lachnospiraceae bacterium]|nr:GGDEF domain-containing protein [Lachnospiraceae bacterium]